MGKLKKTKISNKKAKQMISDAVDNEAKNLIEEFQDIFGEDWEAATIKMIEIDEFIGEDQVLKDLMILNRIDLYEVLLDNTVEEIVEYFRAKASD